jgi:hypothetical protein
MQISKIILKLKLIDLIKENYKLIEKIEYFEKLKVNNDHGSHLHQTFWFFLFN